MEMNRRRTLSLALAAVCLIAAGPALAIVNGSLDTTHQAVGLVAGASWACTGTLIGSTPPLGFVLTAAHCLEDGPPQYFILGNDYSSPDQVLPVIDWRVHPSFEPSTLFFNVAVLTVSGTGASTPVIPTLTPATDTLSVGTSFTVIGYGLTSFPSGETSLRHRASMSIESLFALEFTANIASAGPCVGDSGGPALVMTTGGERVAGIVSSFDAQCSSISVYGRTSPVYDDFIAPSIAGPIPIFLDGFETFLMPWSGLAGIGFLCSEPDCTLPTP
jgi:secreted trypsin-like serine protease